MLCFLGPVWFTQSFVLTAKGGSAVTRWYFNVFRVLSLKHAAFKWKDAISGFLVSPGSAEALIRWRGKIKYLLIAYFLRNICAKIVVIEPCVSRLEQVKGGTFFETQCSTWYPKLKRSCDADDGPLRVTRQRLHLKRLSPLSYAYY